MAPEHQAIAPAPPSQAISWQYDRDRLKSTGTFRLPIEGELLAGEPNGRQILGSQGKGCYLCPLKCQGVVQRLCGARPPALECAPWDLEALASGSS
jgi:hypothetical protein